MYAHTDRKRVFGLHTNHIRSGWNTHTELQVNCF